jgi:hypothetical protein
MGLCLYAATDASQSEYLYSMNRRVPYPRLNKSTEGQRTVGSNEEANWATSESWTRWRTIHKG